MVDPGEWRLAKRIGVVGVIVAVVWGIGLVAAAVAQPEPYAGVWLLVVEMAFTGRAVNIAHGVRDGYSTAFLLFQCGLQDVALLLCAWPGVVLGEAAAERIPVIGGWVRGWHDTARTHQAWMDRFGVIGLIVFVFFPFWSTGVLVGGAVGRLMGMRTAPLIATCLLAHLASVVSLLWFFDLVAQWSDALNSGVMAYLPWIVLGTLFSVWAITQVIKRLRRSPVEAP